MTEYGSLVSDYLNKQKFEIISYRQKKYDRAAKALTKNMRIVKGQKMATKEEENNKNFRTMLMPTIRTWIDGLRSEAKLYMSDNDICNLEDRIMWAVEAFEGKK